MKNILILMFAAFISLPSSAQITLDKTLSDPSVSSTIMFSSNGRKLFGIPSGNYDSMYFYDLNLNHWKTIKVPIKNGYHSKIIPREFITDNLFNSDSLIEYLVVYSGGSNIKMEILNENGQLVMALPDDYYAPGLLHMGNGKYKLAISGYLLPTHVYSLPGTIACDDCVGSTTGVPKPGKSTTASNVNLSDPIPNPTSGEVLIKYVLPADVQTAELVFTNIEGKTIKRLQVNNRTNLINVNLAGVPNGMYYYYIQTPSSKSDTKKLVLTQ